MKRVLAIHLCLLFVSSACQAHAEETRRKVSLLPTGIPQGRSVKPASPMPVQTQTLHSEMSRQAQKSSYPSTHLQRGYYLKSSGNRNQALVEFILAAQENPRQTKAFLEQAKLFTELKNERMAKSALEQALAVSPTCTEARTLLIGMYMQTGNFSGAAAEAGKMISAEHDAAFKRLEKSIADNPQPTHGLAAIQMPHGFLSEPPPEPVAPPRTAESSTENNPDFDAVAQSLGLPPRTKPSPARTQAANDAPASVESVLAALPSSAGTQVSAQDQTPAAAVSHKAAPAARAPQAVPQPKQSLLLQGKGLWRNMTDLTMAGIKKPVQHAATWWPWKDREDAAPQVPNPSSPQRSAAITRAIQAARANAAPSCDAPATRPATASKELSKILAGVPDDKPAEPLPVPSTEYRLMKETVSSNLGNLTSKALESAPAGSSQEKEKVRFGALARLASLPPMPSLPKLSLPGWLPNFGKKDDPAKPGQTQKRPEPQVLPSPVHKVLAEIPAAAPSEVLPTAVIRPVTDASKLPPAVKRLVNKMPSQQITPAPTSISVESSVTPLPASFFSRLKSKNKRLETPQPMLASIPATPAKEVPAPMPVKPAAAPQNLPIIVHQILEATGEASKNTPLEAATKIAGMVLPKATEAESAWLPPSPVDATSQTAVYPDKPAEETSAVANAAIPSPVPVGIQKLLNKVVPRTVELETPKTNRALLPLPTRLSTADPRCFELPSNPNQSASNAAMPTLQPQAMSTAAALPSSPVAPAGITKLPESLPPIVRDIVQSAAQIPALAVPVAIAEAMLPQPVDISKESRQAPQPVEHNLASADGSQAPAPIPAQLDKYINNLLVPVMRKPEPSTEPPAPDKNPEVPSKAMVAAQKKTDGAFSYNLPFMQTDKAYLLGNQSRTIPKPQAKAPEPPKAPPEDELTKRMRYLMEHGNGTLKNGEAFLYSEETGEGVLFLPGGRVEKRKLSTPQDHDEVLRARRPDIIDPRDLQYSLSLLGKLLGNKDAQAEQQRAREEEKRQQNYQAPSLEQLMNKSQKGFWDFFKNTLKM